jgi:two-component system sensor histidine kinase YesM
MKIEAKSKISKGKRSIRKNVIIQYLQDYRYNSILVKSFLLILVLLVCSFMGIMLAVSSKMDSITADQVGTMSITALGKTKDRIDTVMQEVVQISGQLSLDHDVLLFLLPDSKDMFNRNRTMVIKEKIGVYSGVLDYIDSIYIYSAKNQYIVTNEDGGNISEFKDDTWYDNLMEREYEPARMISRLKENNYPYLISYIQPIRLTQMQFLGGIIVNIDVAKLDELVISSGDETKEKLFIVDERSNIIFSSNQKYLKEKISNMDFYKNENFNYKDGFQIINDGQQDIIVTVETSDNFKWKYISTMPLDAYKEYQNGLRDFYMLLLIGILLVTVCAAIGISMYCYMPVKNILNLLKNPDLYVESFHEETGLEIDETHEIALNIIRNLYSNKQMQSELKGYTDIINKAQVTALQAQISPHFLYNTLENIRWKAISICKGDNEVSQIILNLSEILRISLENEQQIITIEEELRNVRLYIEILQLRYEGKIQVNWEIDKDALKHSIVKLSLQPIIENAVYHGIKPLRETGIIEIIVQKRIDIVFIEVSDNGIGMSLEEVDILNKDMKEKYQMKEGHIGIRNVNQRLKLLMGEVAGLEIKNQAGNGTSVVFKLPLSILEAERISGK